MKRNSVVKGALTLTAATLITRILGFFYRVYMSNTIGAEGMGLYQLIMPLYMLMWSITSSGFSTTISKLTAQERAKGEYGNIGRVLKQSLCICALISLAVSVMLYTMSGPFALHVLKDTRTDMPLKLLAFAIPFMSAGSCIRGFFYGMQEAKYPAISQVFEQCVRMGVIYVLAPFLVPRGLEYASLAAIAGVVAGEALSFVYVLVSYIKYKRGNRLTRKPSASPHQIFSAIMSMALPLTFSRVTSSLLSTAENILIPQRLMLFGVDDALSVYGRLTGMAMPLIQLPSAFLTALSISLVPAVSEAKAMRNKRSIASTTGKSIFFTVILGIAAASVLAAFPKEVCVAVYNQRALAPILLKLAFISPFLYLQITLSGILNGLGQQLFLFKISILSSVINILFIYFLIPVVGIDAFIAGWLISLVITSTISYRRLRSLTDVRIEPIRFFVKPGISIFAAGLTAKYISRILPASRASFFFSIFLMLALYFIFLMATGTVTPAELKSIFKRAGKK